MAIQKKKEQNTWVTLKLKGITIYQTFKSKNDVQKLVIKT